MADLATAGAQLTWEVPQCPFSVECSSQVVDDIRLAVVDAFFSLPRGGAEIGGILLGTQEPGRLVITSYQAIECQHASGPSFALSQNDEARLTDQLASLRGQVVGWYHSHTRSHIFLSEADLDIHRRFFPEPWQIALVMKPHTFQPVSIGLFFRERDGSIHAGAAYRELLLEPLFMRPVSSGEPGFHPSPAVPYGRNTENRGPRGPIIDLVLPKEEPEPAARPVLVKAAEPQPVAVTPAPVAPASFPPAAETGSEPPLSPPNFLLTQPEPSARWRAILAIGAGLALGAAGFQTRESWLPRVTTAVKSSLPSSAPPSFGLSTLDSNGQLQIRWDRSSRPVRTGIGAILEIADGALRPQSIALDPQHLQSGVFTYGRQGEKVEVTLTIHMPNGQDIRQVATFLGALPEDADVRRQRDEAAKEAAQLKSDLATQEKRTRKLERSLSDVQKAIKEEQLKRLENQALPK